MMTNEHPGTSLHEVFGPGEVDMCLNFLAGMGAYAPAYPGATILGNLQGYYPIPERTGFLGLKKGPIPPKPWTIPGYAIGIIGNTECVYRLGVVELPKQIYLCADVALRLGNVYSAGVEDPVCLRQDSQELMPNIAIGELCINGPRNPYTFNEQTLDVVLAGYSC